MRLTSFMTRVASTRSFAVSMATAAGGGGAGLTTLGAWKAHGGTYTRFQHHSSSTNTPMTFTVFTPPDATPDSPVPCIFYLSGLTCT